jgi:hypothetical protein
MESQKKSSEKAKGAALKAVLTTVAIGGAATVLLGSPIGWGLTAYYAYKQGKSAYKDQDNWS